MKKGETEEPVRPEAAAEAVVLCLQELRLPAKLETVEGQAQLGWEDDHDVFATDPLGGSVMLRGLSQDYDEAYAQAALERFLGEHQADGSSPYGLEVDGADYSDEFANCVEASGYAPNSIGDSVREELVAKQALAAVTNDWLACARDNGYPDWDDVPVGKADNWLTSPSAIIPLSTTADELKDLLAACPNFDEATAELIEDPEFDWDSDFAAHPAVDIEPPGPPSGEELGQTGQDEYAHYQELIDVLSAAERDYYEERANRPSPAGS
jgi:hypothetical protein